MDEAKHEALPNRSYDMVSRYMRNIKRFEKLKKRFVDSVNDHNKHLMLEIEEEYAELCQYLWSNPRNNVVDECIHDIGNLLLEASFGLIFPFKQRRPIRGPESIDWECTLSVRPDEAQFERRGAFEKYWWESCIDLVDLSVFRNMFGGKLADYIDVELETIGDEFCFSVSFYYSAVPQKIIDEIVIKNDRPS